MHIAKSCLTTSTNDYQPTNNLLFMKVWS